MRSTTGILKHFVLPGLFLLLLLLAGCGAAAPALPLTGASRAVTPGETAVATATQEPVPLPLSEPGSYCVGVREFSAEDASRPGRKVGVRVWYPAVCPEEEGGKRTLPLADPDRSHAPYPLILSSAKTGSALAPYVVTHGFAWAGVTRIDTYDLYNAEMVEQPLDILFALDLVAASPPVELEGLIDTDHAGVTGYSFDGYNALVLGGARIDPGFYLAQCASPNATAEAVLSLPPALPDRYQCALAGGWADFAGHAGEAITGSDDGLWQATTDARIRAVMPLAAEGWLLFGEKGLAAVDRPTLMIVSTRDIWYPENGLILEHLGTADKALISFVGRDHMMIYEPDQVARMAHFAVAFFGTHLQGREELAEYYSEAFVDQHDDLAWGVYEDR